jgi:imidazolonepropionase
VSGRVLWRNARLATLVDGWGIVERGAVVAEGGSIRWAGPAAQLPAGLAVATEHDLGGALLTPGLVDAHTHVVYAGDRAAEFELRIAGASYQDIARAGGGIRATLAATRAAGEEELLAAAVRRAAALRAGGVTTLEVKSGYGLTSDAEARCLRVARRIGAATGQTVRVTYLGAHAVPPEFEGRADDYVDAACAWLPALHRDGLVDAVDAWCEEIAFTPAQVRRVFSVAHALGLPVKLHAEQFSDQGGAALAAGFGALSCDHLEWLSGAGVAALRDAGTVAVLLPGAFYSLRETRVPPVAALRAAGVPMAVATDHNPGSSPTLSLPLMLNMACTLFGLTPLEAWLGATVHAARALGLRDRGLIAPGQRADLAAWDLEHPRELVHRFGHEPCRATYLAP